MRNSKHMKPMIMGGLMALMMMWMLHGALTGDGTLGAGALIMFVVVHVVFVVALLCAALFAARLSPRARAVLDRLHRPSLSHVAAMLGSAMLVAAALHFGVHGLGGI